MKCIHCNKTIVDESQAILITIDGDFACTDECKTRHMNLIDRLVNETANNGPHWWYDDDPHL